ncbi:MAG: hypothetical protein SOW68_00665 [Eubacteriales bacterium]|nr:hypothetical protein [Eubacteriales bacterium]
MDCRFFPVQAQTSIVQNVGEWQPDPFFLREKESTLPNGGLPTIAVISSEYALQRRRYPLQIRFQKMRKVFQRKSAIKSKNCTAGAVQSKSSIFCVPYNPIGAPSVRKLPQWGKFCL